MRRGLCPRSATRSAAISVMAGALTRQVTLPNPSLTKERTVGHAVNIVSGGPVGHGMAMRRGARRRDDLPAQLAADRAVGERRRMDVHVETVGASDVVAGEGAGSRRSPGTRP